MPNNSEITSSNEEKLGILIDSKPNFESHVSFLCRKAAQKIIVLDNLRNYPVSDQRSLILNSVVKLLSVL